MTVNELILECDIQKVAALYFEIQKNLNRKKDLAQGV